MIDETIAAFVAAPTTSIAFASRDGRNRPALFKAVGCRVSPDRRRVTLYADQHLAHAAVRDLRDGHPIAAVFSLPATHRTLQIKGARAEVASVAPADREYCREHTQALVEHIAGLGYPADGVRCYFHYSPEQLVAVTFEPAAIFEQTPGPGAGGPMGQ